MGKKPTFHGFWWRRGLSNNTSPLHKDFDLSHGYLVTETEMGLGIWLRWTLRGREESNILCSVISPEHSLSDTVEPSLTGTHLIERTIILKNSIDPNIDTRERMSPLRLYKTGTSFTSEDSMLDAKSPVPIFLNKTLLRRALP